MGIGAAYQGGSQGELIPYSKELSQQTDSEIRGDELTTNQKESYIEKYGDVPIFDEETKFFGADGKTDNLGLQAALSEEEGEQGFGSYITSMRLKHLSQDSKCTISKLKKMFPLSSKALDSIRKNQIDSLYVLTKCRIAQRRGEKNCSKLAAVRQAAKKARMANSALEAINPRAVRKITKDCAAIGKQRRGFGAKASVKPFVSSNRFGIMGIPMSRAK